jgi:hypothetical protein
MLQLFTHNRTPQPSETHTNHNSIASDNVSASKHVKSSTCSDNIQGSPLLHLPGEIRNRIYGYALTSSAELHYRGGDSSLSGLIYKEIFADGLVATQSFNQLKNTCRQLRAETTDLELQHNDISIEADVVHWHDPETYDHRVETAMEGVSGPARLNSMLHGLQTSRMYWPRNIFIKSDFGSSASFRNPTKQDFGYPCFLAPWAEDAIKDYDRLCLGHPQMSVRYIGPTFEAVMMDYLLEDVLLFGVVTTKALRGRDLSALVPYRYLTVLDELYLRIKPTMQLQSTNLVLWAFADDFVQDLEQCLLELCASSTMTRAEIGPVLPYFRDWILHGI